MMAVHVKIELGHTASIRDKPTKEGSTHDWTVFVRGSGQDCISHFIEKIVFHLDEDLYEAMNRVVEKPPYQVSEQSGCGFEFPIDIYFKNKGIANWYRFLYNLDLSTEEPVVNQVRCETLVFQNPAGEFKKMLLKAGGTMTLDRRTPVCRPLSTIEHVLEWKPGCDDLCVSKTTRSPRLPAVGPKTLICHDMRGGYLEDRLVQGCAKSDCYRFYHWQFVDIFVYFSHHFITIPPPTWTVTAHRHGVKVLGTLITEWDDGKRRCNAFLESERSYMEFADKLVQISEYYGFDGWLVNIENVIEEVGQVKHLQGFVRYLTEQQHKRDPTSEVIWYDSVIDTGKLAWQDELNEKNRMFFDVCDGIFLNYCWKNENLEKSKALAVEAGRPYDVYVGIDVFGRGCLGDGGFNTCEDHFVPITGMFHAMQTLSTLRLMVASVTLLFSLQAYQVKSHKKALAAACSHDLSAALFANGWVYEKLGKEHYVQNENKFWSCLHDLCIPRSITSLPLVTTFCQGQGQHYWSEGKVVGDLWYNQSVQQLQPSFTGAQFNSEEFAPFQPVMETYSEDGFTGGNSLKLEGKISKSCSLEFKLFSLDVDMGQYSERSLFVSFTYKPLQNLNSGIILRLQLNTYLSNDVSKTAIETHLFLPTTFKDYSQYLRSRKPGVGILNQVVHDVELPEVPSRVRSQETTTENYGWKTSYFKIKQETWRIAKLGMISAILNSHSETPENTSVLLGELKIIPAEQIPDSFPTVVFGETVHHLDKKSKPFINAENNELDRDTKRKEQEITAAETHNQATTQCAESDPVQLTDSSTGHSLDSDASKTSDNSTAQGPDIKTANTSDSSLIQSTDSDTVKSSDIAESSDSSSVHCLDCETDTFNCMECFTLQWSVSNPELVQYYRVFQIKEPSKCLILLGQTVLPRFKVTGFKLPLTTLNVSKVETVINSWGDSSVVEHSEAEFHCFIQPVLVTGKAMPFSFSQSNKKSEVFKV